MNTNPHETQYSPSAAQRISDELRDRTAAANVGDAATGYDFTARLDLALYRDPSAVQGVLSEFSAADLRAVGLCRDEVSSVFALPEEAGRFSEVWVSVSRQYSSCTAHYVRIR